MLVGGTEKLRDGTRPITASRSSTASTGRRWSSTSPTSPCSSPPARFAWVSRALAAGLPYVGADFRFDPPVYEPFALPSVAVIGTGKRVGKTAVRAQVARLLARDRQVVVVAMGRGGPPEPELVDRAADRRRAASHARAPAAMPRPTTSRWRRCAVSRRSAAAGRAEGWRAPSSLRTCSPARELAAALEPDVVVFDGSGASIPPVAVERRVLVVGRDDREDAYLNPYRVASRRRRRAYRRRRASCELQSTEPLAGRVAVFTAGGTDMSHLDADVVHVSASPRRPAHPGARARRPSTPTPTSSS